MSEGPGGLSGRGGSSKGGGAILDNTNFYVGVQAFLQGLFGLAQISIFIYQKEVLKLEPSTIQIAGGLVSLPWCIKPAIGFMLDRTVRRWGSTRPVFVGAAAVAGVVFAVLGRYDLPTWVFLLGCFFLTCCVVVLNIISEYLLCVTSKEESRVSGKPRNNFPIFFGFRGLGGIIGSLAGGRLLDAWGVRFVFRLCSALPVLIVLVALLRQEPPPRPQKKRSLRQELKALAELLSRRELLALLSCIFLVHVAPNFDSISAFYLSDIHKFSAADLSDLNSISSLFYVAGLFVYRRWLSHVSARRLFLSSNLLLWLGNVSFMALVLRWVESWGLSPKIFCLLNYGVTSFIAELNSMPVYAIWTSHVPHGLEATSVTLLTGAINLSNACGIASGALVAKIFALASGNMQRFSLALLVQNVYLIFVAGILFVIPIEEPSVHVQLEIQDINELKLKDYEQDNLKEVD